MFDSIEYGVKPPAESKLDTNLLRRPSQQTGEIQSVSTSPDMLAPSSDTEQVARALRKIDLNVIPLAFLMFLFCFIDRSNIGNARLASFEKDLDLAGLDYNSVNSIFYISYILFEIPCTILCKRIGPGWFLPIITILFGSISIATGWVNNYSQLAAVRFLLGVTEAGLMPGLSYYLSRWYRRSELTFRLALYMSAAPLSGAIGGLLASAILRIQRFGSFPAGSWRTIFVLEGLVTVFIGILALAFLPDRVDTAWFLADEDKALINHRLHAERITSSPILDKMTTGKLWRGASNPVTMLTAVTFLLDSITVQGLTFFAPTIVRTIFPGMTTVQQQLLTVPPYVIGAFCIVAVCYTSARLQTRQVLITSCTIPILIGYLIFLATINPVARYVASCLIASSCFTLGPLTHSQAAANVNSDSSRNTSIAVTMFFGNIGSLISTWTFQEWDGPAYRIGNGINFATSSTMFIISYSALLWMKHNNQKRSKRSQETDLTELSPELLEELEWKHPAFRWRL